MSRNFLSYLYKIQLRLLTIFFDLLYHNWARLYDLIARFVSIGQWNNWCETSLQYVKGNKILDLGPGTGHLSTKLSQSGYHVTSLDESWQMSRITAKRMKMNHTKPLVVRGIGQAMPYPENMFDSIVATFPTNHIFSPHTIQEAYRTLTLNGRWIILFGIKITGKSFPYNILSTLYRITGETPSGIQQMDVFPRLIQRVMPFKIDSFWLELPSVSLYYMICSK